MVSENIVRFIEKLDLPINFELLNRPMNQYLFIIPNPTFGFKNSKKQLLLRKDKINIATLCFLVNPSILVVDPF